MSHTKPIILPEVVSETFKNKWEKVSDEIYHADYTSFSSTAMKEILKSRLDYLEFLKRKKEPTDAMKLGSAVHMMVLEPEKFKEKYLASPDFGDLRSPKNREKREEWVKRIPKDAEVLEQKEIDRIRYMVDSIVKNKYAREMFQGSAFEQSAWFRDPMTGVKCKMKIDAIKPDASMIVDLKTTKYAGKHYFMDVVNREFYFAQLMFYAYGVSLINGKEPDIVSIVAVENQPPYDVVIIDFNEEYKHAGRKAVEAGLLRLQKSIETNEFPGKEPSPVSESPPLWLINKEYEI